MKGALVLGFALWLIPAVPLEAELIGEGVNTVRCSERSDTVLPKKMTFVQTISSSAFENTARVALGIDLDYNDESAGSGKAIVTAFRLGPGGEMDKLGKMASRLRNGTMEKLKIVEAQFRPGEAILWKAKLKGLPGLAAEDENCWELGLFVVIADEIPD